MDEIRKTLGNSMVAHTNMNIKVDGAKVVQSIFELLEEAKDQIKEANKVDIKNNNGFEINFEMIENLKNTMNIEDVYRKVITMYKTDNNYLEGTQTDKLGTICLVYEGNTYCLLELVLKSILTHNSIILASKTEYMRGTNEFILILIRRILEAYKIDTNLVQSIYTDEMEKLLSNNASINKVIAIGNKSFQNNIKQISKVETICKGYDNFDLYIESLQHMELIEEIVESGKNIDIYLKKGLEVPFEDYIEVEDIEEAIGMINFNTSGYSSSIFTSNGENGSAFLREVKTDNISVNSSPIINNFVNIETNSLLTTKNMFYPSPLEESNGKNKIEIPTQRAVLEKKKNKEIEKMQKENTELKANSIQIQKEAKAQLEKKEEELSELKRQLAQSQTLASKYMGVFKKSFLSRLFSGLKKEEIDDDSKMLP